MVLQIIFQNTPRIHVYSKFFLSNYNNNVFDKMAFYFLFVQ